MTAIPGGLRRHPRALFEALSLVVRIEIALRRDSFAAVLQRVETTAASMRNTRPIPPQTFERAIAVAYRVLPFDGSCLKRSLVFLLHRRRRGLAAEFRIGVQKQADALSAHAWVEDGQGGLLTDPQAGFSSLPPLVDRARSSPTSD